MPMESAPTDGIIPLNDGVIPMDGNIPMEGGYQMDGSIPMNGPVTTPYYQNQGTPRSPTPAIQGSTTRNAPPVSNVQQVAYVEEIPAQQTLRQATGPVVESQPITKPAYQPVAVRKSPKTRTRARSTGSQANTTANARSTTQSPKRDRSPRPVKRLQASTNPVRSAAAQQATATPTSSPQTKAVLRTGNMSWEKMGLDRPKSSEPKTTAKIKFN